MLTFIPLLREDREIELLLKLDNFDMRDHPNKRMISHFKKSIAVTRSRIVMGKKRLNELTIEYEGVKAGECKKMNKKKKKTKIKNKTSSDDESSSSYLEMLDTDDDDELDDGEEVESRDDIDDVIKVQDMGQCNLELDFDCTSSRITSVDIDLNSSNDSI